MKLAYFVHDLTDAAVLRRVKMLKAGGADPLVIGFRRADAAPADIGGAEVVDLGRTYDGRMGHRANATLRAALSSRSLRGKLAGAEVVIGRTVEMLLVAQAARVACRLTAPLVYECLDVHRLMLDRGPKGAVLRALERALMREAGLLIVSSPAFLEHYFQPWQGVGGALPLDTLLLENKVLDLEDAERAPSPRVAAGRPWRLGWMGAIRCWRSLDILSDLADRRPDLVAVHIHGKPARGEFNDFDGRVAASRVTFHGPYDPDDLAAIYGDVHLSWSIDFMEEGLNSSWLLPNRIYESARHGAPPIALAAVQTGRHLVANGYGATLARAEDVEHFLEALTPAGYDALRAGCDALPRSTLSAGRQDCASLVARLAALSSRRHEALTEPGRRPSV